MPTTAYVGVVQNYLPGDTASPVPKQLKYAVTNKQTITQLAKLINAVPKAPAGTLESPCPSSLGPAYQLDFQDSKDASPVAEVSILCFGVMVTSQGHIEPILSDSVPPGAPGSVLQNVATLLAGSMPQGQ